MAALQAIACAVALPRVYSAAGRWQYRSRLESVAGTVSVFITLFAQAPIFGPPLMPMSVRVAHVADTSLSVSARSHSAWYNC